MIVFFNYSSTAEIYTLSLHDALPISILFNIFGGITRTDDVANGIVAATRMNPLQVPMVIRLTGTNEELADRKSTRLNSSHANISYAVFCLKKKKTLHCQMTNHINIVH